MNILMLHQDEVNNHLIVLVSGDGIDKLLCVPKLDSGIQNEANAVYDLLQLWKSTEKVQAKSFAESL